MAVRAKFLCECVETYAQSKKVKLRAACGDKQDPESENTSFNRYTPSGELWMTIDNPAAAIQFEPGEYYYLDFTKAPA